MTTHLFTVSTWTDSRSNRRDRTHSITAETAEDALYEARVRGSHDVRQNVTVACSITDVDGNGAPKDCPHDEARLWDGFSLLATGERVCKNCR